MHLLGLGFVLAGAPLIVAVVTAVVQVDRLARQGQVSVFRAENATQGSGALVEHIVAMQRSLSQYHVLGDGDFYRAYADRHQLFVDVASRLSKQGLDETLRRDIAGLIDGELRLFQRSRQPVDAGRVPEQLDADFAVLSQQAQSILSQTRELIQREANKAKDAATRLQSLLLYQAAAVIPAAIALGAIFTYLIARPVRQLDQSIHRLGEGELDKVVRVTGPADLEDVGERLNWLRLRIIELEEQKRRFLRHMSHELKTPLTTIRQAAELLNESSGTRSGEDAEILQIMRDSSIELQALIEDLLEFGRTLQPHAAPTRNRPVAIDELVERTLEKHDIVMATRRLRVRRQLARVSLPGDPAGLRTVIDNLLSNAVKHAPIGTEIFVRLVANDGFGVLEIQDEGPGVDSDERHRLFDAFVRGTAVASGHVHGTGLGLAIAREHVEAHHGKIEFVDCSQGARIRVRLPLDA